MLLLLVAQDFQAVMILTLSSLMESNVLLYHHQPQMSSVPQEQDPH